MRVDFEDGQWADIHTVGEMPRRVSVRMQEMLADIPDDHPAMAYNRDMGRLRDTLIAMVIKSWSYEFARTGSAEDVYDLPQASYDKLREETRAHWRKAGFTEAEREETEPAETTPSETTSSA